MRGFQKTCETRATISGTTLKNNLPCISSGIPSLDHVVGGGLPAGSIFAVEEDVLGSHSRVLLKYFLAEGVTCKHALFVASADDNPQDIVNELPLPCIATPDEEVKEILPTTGIDKMKIAWRYEELSQVESSFGNNSIIGHHFDLSRHIDAETIRNSDITYCDLNKSQTIAENIGIVKGFKNGLYYKLLNSIKNVISKEECSTSSKNSNILRISIKSLGSPIWLGMDSDENSRCCYGQDLMKFMFCLRTIVRNTNAVAFVTIPSHLFDDEDYLMRRLLYSVDNAVRIESFAGSSRETNPVYKNYHGLFHITKLSAICSLVPYVPPSLDLAFKLKRKKFLIEKLHLPPELEETSEREQDDITAIPKAQVSCGGFKKKDIDF